MNGQRVEITDIGEETLAAAKAFLERFPETSLFLLSNIRAFGLRLGASLYSGNLKGIEQNGQLRGLFCLTRGGTLLAQTGGRPELAQDIVRACAEEPMPIRGVLGEWEITHAIWEALVAADVLRPTFVSKEVLYRLDLRHAGSLHEVPGVAVRFLEPGDHEQWAEVSAEFQKETHLPLPGTPDERKASFTRSVGLRHWWGAFQQDRLVAMGAIIATHDTMSQIGAVFTAPHLRRRGLSRAVMTRVIDDSRSLLQLEKLFLFTGEENVAARDLYESLGFERVGYFGLFFGEPLPLTPCP
jgi:predicted GNAT family acetyltransferase